MTASTLTRTGASRLSGRARAAYLALRARHGWALPDVTDAWRTPTGLVYAVAMTTRAAADRYQLVCDEHAATTRVPTRAAATATAHAAGLWCAGCASSTPEAREAGSGQQGPRSRALAGLSAGAGDRGRDGRRLSDRPARPPRRR